MRPPMMAPAVAAAALPSADAPSLGSATTTPQIPDATPIAGAATGAVAPTGAAANTGATAGGGAAAANGATAMGDGEAAATGDDGDAGDVGDAANETEDVNALTEAVVTASAGAATGTAIISAGDATAAPLRRVYSCARLRVTVVPNNGCNAAANAF